ncbi:hypothetical protein ACXDF8_10235 [Mycolicibacterium sp. CBM1]
MDANLKVFITGEYVRANSMEAVGPLCEHAFQSITVGTAILGVDGLSVTSGATTYDETEGRAAKAMAINAARVIVAVDGSKVGKVTFARIVGLDQIDDLVTDSSADSEELERIPAAGVQVHTIR